MEEKQQFTPNMDRLKAELGRTPPAPEIKSPEAFAPPSVREAKRDKPVMTEGAPALAQLIKTALRDVDGWRRLTAGEREALDLMATEMSRICEGRNQWPELEDLVRIGQEANANG